MLRRMLRVDNWLNVAPQENMEKDHSFLFLKKNLMKIFFFEKFGNLEFFQGIENFVWWFFFFKQPKKYEPNARNPKALFENFLLFFFFRKFWKSWIFSRNLKFWLMIFFSFLKNLEILNFWRNLKKKKIDWWNFFFFLKNLEVLNSFKELKKFDWWFFF